MMEASSPSKLQDLIELAREPSSARRRELLREVTNLFLTDPAAYGEQERMLFESVLSKLAADMEQEVRAELAQRMARVEAAPRALLRKLATDTITVAEPVLTNSPALSEEDLLTVARTRSQDHLRAISGRLGLSASITDVIVENGDDVTLGVLARNDTADLSRKASETLVDRAAANPDLQESVVARRALPLDLLNEMYFLVGARLREQIMERNAGVDPALLNAALEAGHNRLAQRDGALPPDYPEAQAFIRRLSEREPISLNVLVGLLRTGERTRFLVALADATGVDFHTARKIIERREIDALAIVCKASGFERAVFLTFAVLIMEPGEAIGRAEAYGKLYNDLPQDAALRTMRFWRIRRERGDAIAA